ncbi:MAG: hypothetical protein GF310_11805 [candidate division Zixibacteria bacterium]|nr:hypothetical protein [candidate division Zixibacteria bacterium]
MKKAIIFALFLSTVFAFTLTCNETKIVDTGDDDLILQKVMTYSVVLPADRVAGEEMFFRLTLDAGFPCYRFARYDIEEIDGEIFVTPMVYQRGKSCTEYNSRINRSFSYTIDEPGNYLFHFYEDDIRNKNYEIMVEPAAGE